MTCNYRSVILRGCDGDFGGTHPEYTSMAREESLVFEIDNKLQARAPYRAYRGID